MGYNGGFTILQMPASIKNSCTMTYLEKKTSENSILQDSCIEINISKWMCRA